jgi:glycosyltransferase involved in cell wall biosynthesis
MAVIRAAIGRSCRSAGRVFVHTPTERRRLADRLHIPEDRITVTLPPPRPLQETQAPFAPLDRMLSVPADRRVLFVGQLFAHKNLGVAVAAMARVRARLPEATLFVSGPLDQQPPQSEGVEYLGAVPDTSLLEAYRRATVLVMPSLHETIGLPMLEAMSAGTPVLAADRPYAHDVCGDAAEFFDPLSPESCAAAIVRVLEDEALRDQLVASGHAVTQRLREARPYRTMLSETLALARTPA